MNEEKEILEYKILSSSYYSDLESMVASYIGDGYTPLGGVSVGVGKSKISTTIIYTQAIVLYEKTK